MIKPIRNSYGYRNLLVYRKAEELQIVLAKFVAGFPREKTLVALADQMERSARSTKQNIIEGWKRNSTSEYYQFLGYAVASNAELEADCTDMLRGIYEGKGVEGVEKGEMGELEKIPFYPLNTHLPPCLQLKLRAKELNYLLDKLQSSLLEKMKKERTLTVAEKIRIQDQKEAVFRKEHEVYLKEKGWD